MRSDPTAKRTLSLDLMRAAPMGVIESLGTTFGVLIAVRVFQSGQYSKALIVASFAIGLLLSLFVVQWVKRLRYTANLGIAVLSFASAAGFGLVAAVPGSQVIYLTGVLIGAIGVSSSLPLLSQIYRQHYPDESRGRLFAYAGLVRKVFAILSALGGGYLLSQDLSAYRTLFGLFSGCALVAGLIILKFDPVSLEDCDRPRLFSAFRHVRTDREFRNLLSSWMLLGLGNLLCMALFVEYISEKKYGYDLSEFSIGMITTFVPEATYLLVVTGWGRLFDRWNFYLLRATLNLFFAAGLAIYFLGSGIEALVVGMTLHGIAKAGGNVAWSLWTTKFAQPQHVADYMSVHTFLTGCRGVMAPFLAFGALTIGNPQGIALLGVILILVATFMIAPKIRWRGSRREGVVVSPSPK